MTCTCESPYDRRVIRGTLAALALGLVLAAPASAAEKQAYPVAFKSFALNSGATAGTQVDRGGGLVLAKSGLTTVTYADPFGYAPRVYQSGTWTSPWQPSSFGFMELVSSWNADTPAGTWIQFICNASANSRAT